MYEDLSKDVKPAETRQKIAPVVFQGLIKLELYAEQGATFYASGVCIYDTSRLLFEPVTRRATNFILRYVDWALE